MAAIQDDIRQDPEFQSGTVLILDESPNGKAGDHSAGASRQHNGRLGKGEMSPVGVFLSLATPWGDTWIDGKRFEVKRDQVRAWYEAAGSSDVGEDCTATAERQGLSLSAFAAYEGWRWPGHDALALASNRF